VLASLLLLVAPLSLHGDAVTLGSARRHSPSARCLGAGVAHTGLSPLLISAATVQAASLGERVGAEGVWGPATAADSQLRLRGGKGNVKAGRSKSATRSASAGGRSASVKPVMKKKKKMQKPHNLGPAEWMKKIKRPEMQRKEISMKGHAKGRTKPVFHFWTKSKIKAFTEKRVAFRAKRRGIMLSVLAFSQQLSFA
jgi:hypothetical protein